MKSKEYLKEFKDLNSNQIIEKVQELRKELFDLRFKQATRQLNETHRFSIIKTLEFFQAFFAFHDLTSFDFCRIF